MIVLFMMIILIVINVNKIQSTWFTQNMNPNIFKTLNLLRVKNSVVLF